MQLNMKKYIIYTGILIAGLLLGWILFGASSKNEKDHDHDTVQETNQMWTCSMHPQIMQPEPGNCPICGMDLIPAESGADGLLANQFKLTENAIALANIQTTVVKRGNQNDPSITLSGKIVENEEANSVQVSYFSGRIERLNVSFTGEEVRKGQLLATIYSPELYATQQELMTAASIKESQPQLYRAVRTKLKLWKFSENQINQIEASGEIQENFPVYATVSGTVTNKLVVQGAYVKQGQPLFKIMNLTTVWGNFDVYENQINRFEKGQEVVVTSNAYPNKDFIGKVDFINPVLNTTTRTVTLRVVLKNKNNLFKPGMFITANINAINKEKERHLKIPASAVLWTGERSVVYVKTNASQPIFEMREILLGNRIRDQYVVLKGLFAGNEIVSHGTFTVDAAAQLRGKKSMMNKENGKFRSDHEVHTGMNNNSPLKKNDQTKGNERKEIATEFQEQLKMIYNNYTSLKDFLVREDSKNTSEVATRLIKNLGKIDMKLLSDSKAHKEWVLLQKEITASSLSISAKSNIKAQRNHFKHLSLSLMKAIQLFGIDETVYVEFCPMAENNKGAYWLSKEEKVINPYFGDAMRTCGELKQIIEY